MAARKRDESATPFDYDEAYANLARSMGSLHILRIGEMPHIDLYLDQVLSIVSTELAPLYEQDEKIVTASMVHNYVRHHVIPAPRRKRYTCHHLASLISVCILKRVLSISQVAELFSLCRDASVDLSASYDQLLHAFEGTLAARFTQTPESAPQAGSPSLHLVGLGGEPVTGTLQSLLEGVIGLVANKVYTDKVLPLEVGRMRARAKAGLDHR